MVNGAAIMLTPIVGSACWSCIDHGFGAMSPAQGACGHALFDLAAKIIESHEALTVSTTKPLGTSEEIRMPAFMAPILPLENR
jgi:hypothetical protein